MHNYASHVLGMWSSEEDRSLIEAVHTFTSEDGTISWCEVAEKISGRLGKQARERW